MKSCKNLLVLLGVVFLAIASLITCVSPLTGIDEGGAGGDSYTYYAPAAPGMRNIRLNVSSGNNSRSIMPDFDLVTFGSFWINVQSADNSDNNKNIILHGGIEGFTTLNFQLNAGNYSAITIYGYKDNVPDDVYPPVSTQKLAVGKYDTPFSVASGESVVTLPPAPGQIQLKPFDEINSALEATGNFTGSFILNIDNTANPTSSLESYVVYGLTDTSYNSSKTPTTNTSVPTTWNSHKVNTTISMLKAGHYYVGLEINCHGQTVKFFETMYIYANIDTVYTYTVPEMLEANDPTKIVVTYNPNGNGNGTGGSTKPLYKNPGTLTGFSYGSTITQTDINNNFAIGGPVHPIAPNSWVIDGFHKKPNVASEWNFGYDKVLGNMTLYAHWLPAAAHGLTITFVIPDNGNAYFAHYPGFDPEDPYKYPEVDFYLSDISWPSSPSYDFITNDISGNNLVSGGVLNRTENKIEITAGSIVGDTSAWEWWYDDVQLILGTDYFIVGSSNALPILPILKWINETTPGDPNVRVSLGPHYLTLKMTYNGTPQSAVIKINFHP